MGTGLTTLNRSLPGTLLSTFTLEGKTPRLMLLNCYLRVGGGSLFIKIRPYADTGNREPLNCTNFYKISAVPEINISVYLVSTTLDGFLNVVSGLPRYKPGIED